MSGVPPTASSHAHLILVGLPGAGKSTLGQRLAQQLQLPFVDLDREIERLTGRSIAEIFATEGEGAFRRLEREVTHRLAEASSRVVSPGGGWITQPDVVGLLRPPSRIIHLKVSPATARARMGNEVAHRPLLMGGDPVGRLTRLERDRAAAYGTSDAVLDTETLTLQELVSNAAALASAWGVGVG